MFEQLRKMSFDIYLISNANYDRVKLFSEMLKVEAVHRAEKPYTQGFEKLQESFEKKNGCRVSPKEMAHVGNSMIKDIATGNSFGATTCLVRNVGILSKAGKIVNPFKTQGQQLRDVLLERGIWRKHHLKEKGDQYYQLEDTYLAQNIQR